MAFCPACGNTNADAARFCVDCGRPLPLAPPAEPPAAAAPPPSEPGGRASAPSPPLQQAEAAAVRPAMSRLPTSWLPGLRFGGSALAIGLAAQYALGAVMAIIQMLTGAGVDWGATLRAPLTVFLALHGPVEGLGLWATGVGWVVLAFWLAGRHLRRRPGQPASPSGVVLAAQAALVYTVAVLVLALLFDPEALPIDMTVYVAGVLVDPAAYGGWSPWLVATLGALTALLGAAISVMGGAAGAAAARRLPAAITAGWAGTRALLATVVPGVLGVVVIGALLEVIAGGAGIALGAAYLLTLLLAAVAWGGLNVGVAFTVFSMRFFLGDGFVLLRGRPGWVLACIGIVAAAYLRGGYRAARERGPAPVGQIVTASAAAGAMAAVLFMIGAALGTGTAPDLAGPALGLGLLWSLVAVVGGLWQAGFRPGRSPVAPAGPAPPPTE
ncbi:MAG: zinc ribbon domain-containing protein [Actinobacteria bacterium]|nr:zinc ribbon domain-containing protein [Actinomycetota bacterium]